MAIRPHPSKGPNEWYIYFKRDGKIINVSFTGTESEAAPDADYRIRAGIVKKPEDYKWSSTVAHLQGEDDILVKATPPD